MNGRLKYLNSLEMRREFRERVASHRFIVHDGLDRLKTFLKAFDISKSYPEQWWVDMLACKRRRDWLNPSAKQMREDIEMCLVRHQLYDLFNKFISYTIPTTEVLSIIKVVAGAQAIHEHMAGTGYWAYHLKKMGCKVRAFDKSTPSPHGVSTAKTFTEVTPECVSKAVLPPDVVLMLAWVPHGDTSVIRLLKQMQVGQKLIYIGDKGCCGDKEMHDYIDDHFLEGAVYDPPKLMEVRDGVWFYERMHKERPREARGDEKGLVRRRKNDH